MNLGTVAAIRSGLVLSRKLSPEISSYRYPLLNLRAIHPDGYVRPDSLEVFYATEPLRQEYLTQQDDIIIRLEEYGADVGYAIVLATPDDEGKAKTETSYKARVRQNVVLELGMFLAKLGRERVAILLKEANDFEKPSDIHGLIYIPFQNRVDEVSINLIRELSRQGYKIDPTRI